jgi:hypothetical protein
MHGTRQKSQIKVFSNEQRAQLTSINFSAIEACILNLVLSVTYVRILQSR